MNPKEALKIVEDEEAKAREAAEKEERRLGWIKIAQEVASDFGLITRHDIHYDSDGRVSIPFCARCGGHSYRGTLDERGPCVRPYSTDVGAAFELVNYITSRGWVVAFSLDPQHAYDKVLIQGKRRNQSVVEILFRHDQLPKAILGLASAWARKRKEQV